MWSALQQKWRIYLIEAWALGMFMISACFFTILIESPIFPIRTAIESPLLRRFLIGIAMGLTAILLIYSKWGKKSGAHMNPAVTLTFLALDRIRWEDAIWYIIAQFAGGALGVFLFKWFWHDALAAMEIGYAATVPGAAGVWVAFGLEFLISTLLFTMVLFLSNTKQIAPFTGYFVGALIVIYITFEAPFSGMSMNPARTFASAINGNIWTGIWVYFTAPVLGMNLAGYIFRRIYRERHDGNCLTMDCHVSGEQHDNDVYEVLGPKNLILKHKMNNQL